MAESNFIDYVNTIRDAYWEFVSDGILEDTVLFKELEKANGPATQYSGIIGGRGGIVKNVTAENFQWRVLSAEMDAFPWGPSTVITPETQNILATATLGMGGYHIPYFVSKYEELSMGGPEQFVPLVRLYDEMAQRRAYTLFEQKFLADDSAAGGWKGLPVFMTDTGTYATGIDLTADYAKPTIFDYSGSGQLLDVTILDRIDEVVNKSTHGDDQNVDERVVGFMRRTDWLKTKSLIQDNHRYIDVDTEMHKFGFKNFTYSGTRFYWSARMESDSVKKVYVLNMNYIGLAHATGKLMTQETAKHIDGQPGTLAVAFHKGQIFCTNTRKQAVINNTDKS